MKVTGISSEIRKMLKLLHRLRKKEKPSHRRGSASTVEDASLRVFRGTMSGRLMIPFIGPCCFVEFVGRRVNRWIPLLIWLRSGHVSRTRKENGRSGLQRRAQIPNLRDAKPQEVFISEALNRI